MKTNLKDYAYFSKNQIKGIFLLASLMLLFFSLPSIFFKTSFTEKTDFSEFEKEIIEFEASLKNTPEVVLPSATITLFNFDPNTVSKENLISLGVSSSIATTFINFRNKGFKFHKKEDLKKVYGIKEINPNKADKATLLSLGLSEKIVQIVLNYRNSGAAFRKKEDFKKIYGLSKADYLTLAPFIEIPEQVNPIAKKARIPKVIPQSFSKKTSIKIDINNSSIEDWKQLNGVGEITAKRIVNFRDKLGGFISIDQLKTTYNLADSVIDKVAHQLIISPIQHKIAINTISAEHLKLHPYIKKKQAYLIVNYRTNHGKYHHISDLEKVKALTSNFIEQISPYLSFE